MRLPIPRRLLGLGVVVLIVGLLAGGAFLRLRGGGEGDAAQSSAAGGDRAATSAATPFATDIAIPVEGAAVVRDTLVISVTAAGQGAAERRATLKAHVEGRVRRIHVRENDRVREGEVLMALDPTQYELELAKAEAQLARAQAEYRALTLFDDQIQDSTVRAERERVARAKSGLNEAEVGLREARLKLERTEVRAPFAGRAASLRVVPGQWAGVGDELLTVVDLDPMRVEVQVLESEVTLLARDRRATISFAAFPGETFTGRVETINPLVDEQTRTARVTVSVPNPQGRILPGMYARVALEARKLPNRVLVPRVAILERDRRTMLFVFEGEGDLGLSKWRYVTTGLANDSLVEIVPNPETSMVEPGEIVLTDGHYTLIHDATVRLVADVGAAGGRPR